MSSAYEIAIKTTDGYSAASTSADVFIQLVGRCGTETEWTKLTSFWKRCFKRGNTDRFNLTLRDVGIPLLIRLKLDKESDESEKWGCDYVNVTCERKTVEFPVYDWVLDSIEACRGKATLPQQITNSFEQHSRKNEQERNKRLYQWIDKTKAKEQNYRQGRYLDVETAQDTPQIFQYDDAKWQAYDYRSWRTRMDIMFQRVKGFFRGISSFDDYNDFHKRLIIAELPSSHERWNQDEEFGRQMINTNSRSIRRSTDLPDYCKVTDSHLIGLLPEGTTLRGEIEKNCIFIVDHVSETSGITRNTQNGAQQLYCADAIALFHAIDGKLLPLAIQLEPENEESIFTPNDAEYDWLLAKIYFRNSDYMVHEWMEHFRVHTVIEPITISLFRNLPRAHPIYKLMRTHLWNIPIANQRGRDFFFGRDVADIYRSQDGMEMTNKGFAMLDFDDLNFPKMLEKRGLTDTEVLPNYYIRDDAMLYWNAIRTFSAKVITHFYKSDEDVTEDHELQAWIKEAVVEGYQYDEHINLNCPESFKTIQDLHNFITTIIFHVSVYHAIVHFPQYEVFKFAPNSPGGMRLPIHKKGEGSLQRALDSLPTSEMSTIQVAVSYVACRFGPNETLLGQYPMRLFTEEEIQTFIDEFASDIEEAGTKIRQLNATRTIPDEYLVPERIPASILG